jgi:hypothetical protein
VAAVRPGAATRSRLPRPSRFIYLGQQPTHAAMVLARCSLGRQRLVRSSQAATRRVGVSKKRARERRKAGEKTVNAEAATRSVQNEWAGRVVIPPTETLPLFFFEFLYVDLNEYGLFIFIIQ